MVVQAIKLKNFHKKIELTLKETKEFYQEATVEAPAKAELIKEQHNLNYKRYRYNFKKFFATTINDSKIDYSLGDFVRKYEDLQRNLDMFLSFSPFILQLHDNCKMGIISKEFYIYIMLKFYASNYETIISFFIPPCNKLNFVKKKMLTPKGKTMSINTAGKCLKFLGEYDKPLYNYMNKIYFRELRNAIAHDSYWFIKDKIYYFDGKRRKRCIHLIKLLESLTRMGYTINNIQKTYAEFIIKCCEDILKQNLTEKQAKTLVKTTKV